MFVYFYWQFDELRKYGNHHWFLWLMSNCCVDLICWRWAIEEETVKEKHWMLEYSEESPLVLPATQIRELHVKTLRENCIMESTVPFLDGNILRAGTYCRPFQAVLTQNLPSKPITGRSQSDIHKKFSILSFKWSFPLVTHALHFY